MKRNKYFFIISLSLSLFIVYVLYRSQSNYYTVYNNEEPKYTSNNKSDILSSKNLIQMSNMSSKSHSNNDISVFANEVDISSFTDKSISKNDELLTVSEAKAWNDLIKLDLTIYTDEQINSIYKEKVLQYSPKFRYYDYFGVANTQEEKWCIKKYFAASCWYFYQFSKKAAETAIKEYPGYQRDNKADAFRHSYFAALLTRKYGKDVSWDVTTRYEEFNPNRPIVKNMDLYNNARCRDTLLYLKSRLKWCDISDGVIIYQLKLNIKNGMMKYIKKGKLVFTNQ